MIHSSFRNLCLATGLLTSIVWAKPGIVIPSDVEKTGIQTVTYQNPLTAVSWESLNSFTDQTLENFEKGDCRGILCVHSLEDIMGASEAFRQNWNLHQGDDRGLTHKYSIEEFHQTYTPQEYIDYYIPYVLAERALISCSMLAFNKKPQFSLTETFAPVSFILKAPKECVMVTERHDARTSVVYGRPIKTQYLIKSEPEIKTLDTIIRYPEIGSVKEIEGEEGTPLKEISYSMNEVALLNCTYNPNNKTEIFRPEIVGVLINHSTALMKMDYGNAFRNKNWVEAAQNFSQQNGLPLITIEHGSISRIAEKKVMKMVNEWYENPALDISLNAYYWERDSYGDIDYDARDKTFMLSNAQLQTYGLSRQ